MLTATLYAAEAPETELLLSGGTLYSLTHRSYKSVHLPNGWSVASAGYSPDGQTLALVVKGVAIPPPPGVTSVSTSTAKHSPLPPVGPINKTIRGWKPSTHLLLVDRASGSVQHTWTLSGAEMTGDWTLVWTTATDLRATVRSTATPPAAEFIFNVNTANKLTAIKAEPPAPSATPTAPAANDCHRTLTETQFHGKTLRFIKDAATCSNPPETSDIYQLIQPNTPKDDILWDYRVPVDQTACAEPYACYTGSDAQFLSLGGRRFLVWDGDFFTLQRTADGIDAQLITQLLPQFSHPLGIAAGNTVLNSLDWETAMPFQPVSESLRIAHSDTPQLYAQNFLPTRSFNATVEVGPYKKNVMVPAGTQVGPVEIGSFKDSAYTPVLSTLRWTSFHHRADPIYCKSPYTISANTSGMIVSIKEDQKGALQCEIRFQEDH